MKRLRLFSLLAALLIGLSLGGTIGLTTTGCATNATVQRKQFVAISDAAEGVRTAMLIFNDRYQAGRQTEDQRTKVLASYAIYQKAALSAVADEKAGKPVNALQIVNDAALPLLDLIASFAPKGATP